MLADGLVELFAYDQHHWHEHESFRAWNQRQREQHLPELDFAFELVYELVKMGRVTMHIYRDLAAVLPQRLRPSGQPPRRLQGGRQNVTNERDFVDVLLNG